MEKLKMLIEAEKILNNAVPYSKMYRWNRLTESAKLEALQAATVQELVAYLIRG
jgi:hypothetical protein